VASRGSQHKFVCPGVVVETFEKGGEHLARVSLKPACIELAMNARLGDVVTIDGSLTVRKISPTPPSPAVPHPESPEVPKGGKDR